jgi:hypothetical protein
MQHFQVSLVVFSVALAACTLNRVPTAASSGDRETTTTSSANRPNTVQTSGRLFTTAPGAPAIDTARETGVLRNRYVGVDLSLLGAASHGSSIGLNLFEDVFLTAVVDSVESSGSDATITGHIADRDGSSVTIVASDGVVIGSIVAHDAQYQIRYAGNGVHAVREFDTSQLPRESPPQNPTRRPPPAGS